MTTKKKAAKAEPRKPELKAPEDGEVHFRVKRMKGFKPGQTICIDKKRAEGWEKKGYGKVN